MHKAILAISLAVVVGLMFVAAGAIAITTTGWQEYVPNPIYSPGHKAYYPTVLYDAARFGGGSGAPTYKMWYASQPGQIGYAHSTNGINWTSAGFVSGLTVGSPNHPLVEYDAGGFGGGPPYRMWYWDMGNLYSINALAYAESDDGMNWSSSQYCTEYAGSVIGPSPWRGSYGPCDILYHPLAPGRYHDFDEVDIANNRFVMYYDLTTGGDESIGLAFSDDGINWVGYSCNPVLRGTQPWETGDREYVSRCTVIFDGTTYNMWYSGGIHRMDHGIGYAASPDGIAWTKDSDNPIFHKNDGVAWRNSRTYCPMVIDDKMWFSGKDVTTGTYTIGLAVPIPPPPEEVWVDDDYCNGCPNGGHTWGYDAFDNIQDGVDAVAGSKVNVAEGTYYGAIVDKPVYLKGIGGAVINDGPPHPGYPTLHYGLYLLPGASAAKIKDFTFECDEASWSTPGLVFPIFANYADDVTVEHCTFNDALQGISNWHGNGWKIKHNEFNGLQHLSGGGLGIFIGSYQGATANENKIEHNEIEAHFGAPPPDYTVGGLTLMSDHRWGAAGGDIKYNEIKHNKVSVTGSPTTNACELTDMDDDDGFDTDEVIGNLFKKNDFEESTIPWAFYPDELVGYNFFENNKPQPGGMACGLPTTSLSPMPYGPPREGVQVAQRRSGSPVAFSLSQNNPNPFARETSVSYMLPASGHATLKIYDVSGRVVETLVNTELEPGIYTVSWDRSDVSSGTYFYRLSSNGETLTRKMTVVR